MKIDIIWLFWIFFPLVGFADSHLSDFPAPKVEVLFANNDVDEFKEIAWYLTGTGNPYHKIERQELMKILKETELVSASIAGSPIWSEWRFEKKISNGVLILRCGSKGKNLDWEGEKSVELHLALSEEFLIGKRVISVVPIEFEFHCSGFKEEEVKKEIQPYLGKELFRIALPINHPESVESLVALIFLLEDEIAYSDGSGGLNPPNDQCGISLEEARKIEEEKKKERRPF